MKQLLNRSPLILLIFLSSVLYSQSSYKDSLDLRLTKAFQKTKVPGFTALVITKKGIAYKKCLGFADSQHQIPYSANTIENIGSISKTFIAVALMKAIELGYFNLNTNINDILPFRVVNPYYPNDAITVQQLTTHTSGIVDNDSIYHKSYLFNITCNTNKEALAAMTQLGYTGGLTDTTLNTFLHNYLIPNGALYTINNFYNSKPGERSSYSNIASALAAYLIEVKAGMSFAAFTEKYILHPLQMNHSAWLLSEVDMKKHAIPYVATELPLPFYSLTTYPDGGLITSADDLSKYLKEMMNALNGKPKLLNKKSVERMFMPAFPLNSLPQNFNASKRNKGIFWNLYTDGFIGHDGDDPGVSTNILFNKDCAILFMANIYLEDRSDFIDALKAYANQLSGNSHP